MECGILAFLWTNKSTSVERVQSLRQEVFRFHGLCGAEITVDEKFMGSTPSSLRLAVGDHKIKLEKSGFRTWNKTLTVGAGAAATVDATLEKQE
jgi:hypothetical protein